MASRNTFLIDPTGKVVKVWTGVNPAKHSEEVLAALSELNSLENELNETGIADANRAFNLSWHDWLNLKSLVQVSAAIAEAALARTDSRGAHYREDFPLGLYQRSPAVRRA